jgi:hypothetical protein
MRPRKYLDIHNAQISLLSQLFACKQLLNLKKLIRDVTDASCKHLHSRLELLGPFGEVKEVSRASIAEKSFPAFCRQWDASVDYLCEAECRRLFTTAAHLCS